MHLRELGHYDAGSKEKEQKVKIQELFHFLPRKKVYIVSAFPRVYYFYLFFIAWYFLIDFVVFLQHLVSSY